MIRDTEIKTIDDLDTIMLMLRAAVDEQPHIISIFPATKHNKQRSPSQRASLEVYCKSIAKKMNDSGTSQKQLVGSFKEGFELPVSNHMIKDIFREVGKAMFKKESTADLSTTEINEVHMVVDQRFGEVAGVTAPWPSNRG